MYVETLRSEEAYAALTPEWDALAKGIEPWTPFLTPLWNVTYWRHFRRSRPWVLDRLHGWAIRHDNGQLAAVAPMQMTTRPAYGAIKLRQLHYFGADRAVTEIRGLICHPVDEVAAVALLIKTFRDGAGDWDWLQWGGLLRHGGARIAVREARAPASERCLSAFYIDLPDCFAALRARLSRNTKEALRKCYNSLARDNHRYVFEVVTRPEDVDSALDLFFQLHKARADADFSVTHVNVFTRTRAQVFLRDYARCSAERDELRIFQLRVNGAVVAMRIGFCSGSELYLYYSGYRPEWRRYSVMTTTIAETLAWAIATGLRRVSLSVGHDQSKLRWRPQELQIWEGFQASPNLRGRAMAALFQSRTPPSLSKGNPEPKIADHTVDFLRD